MKIRAPYEPMPDQIRRRLDLNAELRETIVYTFVVMAELEPKLRRWDWIAGLIGMVTVLGQIVVGAWAGFGGWGLINLVAAILLALNLQRVLWRAHQRRQGLGALATMAHYVMSRYSAP